MTGNNTAALTRRELLKLIGMTGLVGGCSLNTKPTVQKRKPNIILCMVDDMGKEGVGCYSAPDPSPTPVLDRLSREGMKFNNYYVMPQCTPTRVALLTGQYPFRNGWVNHYDVPRWNLKGFNPDTNPCIAQVLKSAGYKTGIAGKWQINDFRREPTILNDCGFDEYCMWTGGESKNPKSDCRYWNPYIHTKDGSKTYQSEYGPDMFNAFIADFIDRYKNEPMFIYYPMVLRHGPLERQPLDCSPETYIDHLIGNLEKSLKKAGIFDNTILIFKTDNGRIGKGKTIESGVCVPLIISGPGIVPRGVETDALVDVTDFLPTLAELAEAKLPSQYTYDGKSFAGLLTGRANNSTRDWIMAMGGRPCSYPKQGNGPFEAKNKKPYRDRVIRDKTFKAYVNEHADIVKVVDLKTDPGEKKNILNSTKPEVQAALRKFKAVLEQFPAQDANPRY